MNQEKIGKFILECRKKKGLTQAELAEQLGVTDKSVGNWENGRNMPDLSLFKPLCDILGITINELLSGERIKDKYQEKFEENIINTIDYSTKKIRISTNTLNIALILFGLFIIFMALNMFESDSSWGSIYSCIGLVVSTCGTYKMLKKKKLLLSILYFIIIFILIFILDIINTIRFNQLPRFCLVKSYSEDVITCDNGLFKTYKVNYNTSNDYVIVDFKHQYKSIPIVPFDRSKSGIDNIIKYKNKYIGNNSNTSNLVNSLPLSEYGSVIEIDSKNLGLTINYHVTDWYINESLYLEKSLLYNTVSIFLLIDNVDYIKYNFSGNTYTFYRNKVESTYPQYNKINKDKINYIDFNKYLESKINDEEYVKKIFDKIKEQ